MTILPSPNRLTGEGAYFADVLLRATRQGDCILWDGALDSGGYGQLKRGPHRFGVHRIAYTWAHGAIRPDLVIDHLCHDPRVCSGPCQHRRCVNPGHLAAVTEEENLRRQGPAFRTHCTNGHEFTPENVGRVAGGRRKYCKECAHASYRNRSAGRSDFTAEVRAWLIQEGLAKPGRGRLSRAAVEAWDAAHPDRPFAATPAERPTGGDA